MKVSNALLPESFREVLAILGKQKLVSKHYQTELYFRFFKVCLRKFKKKNLLKATANSNPNQILKLKFQPALFIENK